MGCTVETGPLDLAVALTDALSSLAAVATPNWCERAAECLALLAPGCAVAAAAVVADENGRVRCLESVGAALNRSEARARPMGRALPLPQRPTLAEPPVPDRLRAGMERLGSLGWVPGPGGLSVAQAGFLADLPGGRGWRSGPVGRVWSGIGSGEVLAAMVPLPGPTGRALVVQAGACGTPLGEGELAVVRAILPVLARRATRALLAGPGNGPGRWLTSREHEILERIILGQSVREIADELGRSPHTVHDYVKALHRKLGAASRGELVGRALWHGGVRPGERREEGSVAGAEEGPPLAGSMIEPAPLGVPRAAGAA